MPFCQSPMNRWLPITVGELLTIVAPAARVARSLVHRAVPSSALKAYTFEPEPMYATPSDTAGDDHEPNNAASIPFSHTIFEVVRS